MTPLAVGLALLGLVWGIVADRISARWPEHLPETPDAGDAPADEAARGDPGAVDGGSDQAPATPEGDATPPLARRPDWRTAVVAIVGALSLGAVGIRFAEPAMVALFSGWTVILILLLATDLDQRLLPDLLTLPLIPAAAIAGLAGWNPLVAEGMILPLVAAIAIPAGLYLVSIPYGSGAIGIGDLKLLVSVGLALGFARAFYSVFFAAVTSGLVVLVLMAAGLIGRRSYIPFGPFLIIGALWAAIFL